MKTFAPEGNLTIDVQTCDAIAIPSQNVAFKSTTTVQEHMQHIYPLIRNYGYMISSVVLALGIGLFQAITALLQQFIEPYGYDTSQAGILGALFIVGGILGAGITAFILDRTKKYKEVMRVQVTGATVCFIWFAIASKQ